MNQTQNGKLVITHFITHSSIIYQTGKMYTTLYTLSILQEHGKRVKCVKMYMWGFELFDFRKSKWNHKYRNTYIFSGFLYSSPRSFTGLMEPVYGGKQFRKYQSKYILYKFR